MMTLAIYREGHIYFEDALCFRRNNKNDDEDQGTSGIEGNRTDFIAKITSTESTEFHCHKQNDY